MWNDNNPVAYSDPSGYCPVCVVGAGAGIADVTLWGIAAVASLAGATAISKAANANRDKINNALGAIVDFSKKAAKKAIKSLTGRVNEHQAKIDGSPESDSVGHWQGEIKAFQGSIARKQQKINKSKKKGKAWKQEPQKT